MGETFSRFSKYMENLFSPNPEILDIEKQSSKVIIKYSHLGEMFPMLPQGFYFLKNVFDRLCETSGKLEKAQSLPLSRTKHVSLPHCALTHISAFLQLSK